MADESGSSWRQVRLSLAWIALAVAGHAASLALIDAGNRLHYQHYLTFDRMLAEHPAAFGVIVLQAAVVLLTVVRGGWSRLSAARPMPAARTGFALVVAAVSAATVSPDPRQYATELAFAIAVQWLSLATVLLAVFSIPDRAIERIRQWTRARWIESASGDLTRRTVWLLAAVATIISATLAVTVYEGHPHVPDELTYVLHAKYLAHGMLTMPGPPVREAFDIDLFIYEPGRWYSSVPPGWPAVLAVGTWLGAPWLVNPLLTGCAVLLAHALFVELYDRRTAGIAAALLAVSPWFLLLGMSLMTQTLSVVCVLVAALGVARSRRTGSLAWSLAGGLAVGTMSLIRPLDGVIIGVLMAAWSLGVGGTRLRVPALGVLLAATIASGAVGLAYNTSLTGNPLRFPVTAFFDEVYGPGSNDYGFGPDRGMGWGIDPNPGHGPVDGLINANLNLFGLNTDLFGWSIGSLVLAAIAICAGRFRRADWLMLATMVTIVTAYFFYWFSGGPDFGARYWFPVIIPLVALSARGFELVEARMGARAGIAVTLLVIMGTTLFVPWRAVDKYWHFRGMQGGVATLADQAGLDGALVLVRGPRFPDYASASVENPPDLQSVATVYAWDRDAGVRARVLAAYPDRPVWILDGPSVTGDGFHLSDGPVDRDRLPTVLSFDP